MYLINEIFYSLQGEGLRVGVPSIFVRSGLCNFKCQGFGVEYESPITKDKRKGCDSYYAVDKEFKSTWDSFTNWEELVEEIESRIPKFGTGSSLKPDIVLTGGEPLIYWDDRVFQKTISYFHSRGHSITIETNGSLDIEFDKKYQKDIIFSTSVKLSTSGEPEYKRINIDSLTNIANNSENFYLKFVVSKDNWDNEIKEIKEILKELPVFVNVYLMPLGDTIESLEKNSLFVFEKALEMGTRFSDRTHIRIFDNKQGV